MQAKHDVLEEAFAKAASQLAALRDRPEYVNVFERLANEALDEFGDRGPDKLIVFVDARDLRICRAFFERKSIPYEIDTSKTFWGGLEIVSFDTRFKVSNTLEGRLAREKNGLLAPVAQILFDD
jgi:vacuolar-type H+-ATPase subunit E/Vma4